MLPKILTTIGVVLLLASAVFWLRSRPVEKGDLYQAVSATTVPAVDIPTESTMPEPVEPDEPSIADLIRVVDAPDEVVPEPPVAVRIGGIEVEAPVVPVGVEPDGQMEIPRDVDEIGWYSFGPSPGQQGSAVLAGHVSGSGQGRGAFYDIKRLTVGDPVEVDHADGSTSEYVVVAVQTIDKGELPTDEIFRRDGGPILTLITCGGSFSRSLNSYDSNVVAVAVPIEAASETDADSQ